MAFDALGKAFMVAAHAITQAMQPIVSAMLAFNAHADHGPEQPLTIDELYASIGDDGAALDGPRGRFTAEGGWSAN